MPSTDTRNTDSLGKFLSVRTVNLDGDGHIKHTPFNPQMYSFSNALIKRLLILIKTSYAEYLDIVDLYCLYYFFLNIEFLVNSLIVFLDAFASELLMNKVLIATLRRCEVDIMHLPPLFPWESFVENIASIFLVLY